MNNFKNRELFIVLTLAAFSILALASYKLASYTLSSAPPRPETNQPESS